MCSEESCTQVKKIIDEIDPEMIWCQADNKNIPISECVIFQKYNFLLRADIKCEGCQQTERIKKILNEHVPGLDSLLNLWRP